MSEFKDMLKYFRMRDKLSQSELAAKIGVSTSTISMYEVGKREPDFETEEKLADLFNTDLDTLRGRDVERDFTTRPGVNIVDKNGNAKSYDMDSIIYNILQCLIRLPQESQEMIYDVAESQEKRNKKVIYVDNPNERKKKYNLMPNAAHDSTDRKVTEADIKHDEDIMNDDNF